MLQHDYAEVNGVRLHYVTSGQGPLILFVHGFPEFWYAWKRQLEAFGTDRQAVALDMRGYNLSSKPEQLDQYRVPLLVEDLRALADQLVQQRFTLVGHDWGGVVAWAFAAAHPDRLDKLVIVNAPYGAIFARELRQNPAQQRASRYMLTFRSADAEELLSRDNYAYLQQIVLSRLLQDGHLGEGDRQAYLAAWSQPGALTGGLNYYRAAAIGPTTEQATANDPSPPAGAPTIHVPTLVLWGEKDEALLTGNLDGLDQFVDDLTIQRIPDGTHWVIHEQPEVINGAIRAFIERD